jgi:tight adherence protein B
MIFIAIFLVLALGLFAFLSGLELRTQSGRGLRERLQSLDAAAQRSSNPEVALLRDELLSTVPQLNKLLVHWRRVRRLQMMLMQAGLQMRAGKLILICACSGAFLAVVVNFFLPGWLAFIALLMGCMVPLAVVAQLRARRFAKFEKLFPEAIDLLGRAVRAGHSFSTSLELIADEVNDPVGGEFRKLFDEQKFGLPMRDALANLVERVPLVDVRLFVLSVLVQRENGGNLAEVLDKISYVIRERFKIQRQVRVYTAQARLTMVILMAMPFIMAVLMTLVSPQYLRVLVTDPIGHNLIGLGLVMMTCGFFILRKIARIRV